MIKKQAEKKGERKSFGHNKRRSSDCFNPFGVIIRQQNDKPAIQQLSPGSDVSSEHEEDEGNDICENIENEKHNFKLPADYHMSSDKIKNHNSGDKNASKRNSMNQNSNLKNTGSANDPFNWDGF